MDFASILGILIFIGAMAVGVGDSEENLSLPTMDEIGIFFQFSSFFIVIVGSSGACLLRCQLSEYFLMLSLIHISEPTRPY